MLRVRDPGRPPRRRLDQAQVVAGALALLDEVGLDGLTMRNLAERLGVRATALYRHVRDKDELLVLLADALNGEVAPVDVGGDWRDELRRMAARLREVLLAHRDAARILASTGLAGPQRLRHIDALLGSLVGAGFPPRDAVRAAYHFNNLVTEFVADEVRLRQIALDAGATLESFRAAARAQLAALPAGELPHLVAHAEHLADDDPDGSFAFAVDTWIAGLEQRLAGRRLENRVR